MNDTDPDGYWYIRIGNKEYRFKAGTADTNPLETIDPFDKGDAWLMDVELHDEYPSDPDDDSFVLVPKEDVDEVFFKSFDSDDGPMRPQSVEAKSVEDVMSDLAGGDGL